MPREINLLPESVIKLKRQEAIKRWAQIVSILIILVAVLISFFLMFQDFSLGSDLVQTNNLITAKEQQVDELQNVERVNVIVKQKLESISRILSEDPEYKETITTLIESVSPGISVNGMKVNENNTLEIIGMAANSTVFKDLLTKLTQDSSERFPKVTLKTASMSQDGRLTFSLAFRFTQIRNEKEVILSQ